MSRLRNLLHAARVRWFSATRNRVSFDDLLRDALAARERLSLRVEAWERALLEAPHSGGPDRPGPGIFNRSTSRIRRI